MRDEDDFLGQDIGYPNRRAQYRGYRLILRLFFAAAVLAVIFGLMEGAKGVFGAFPSFPSLLERAAWVKFLGGFSTLTKVGVVVVLAGLVLYWRKRRSALRRRR